MTTPISASISSGPRKYRSDIDGLRAVAVMLVVLNHLQFRHFDGGYVGVDVFFVISGYLIGASLIGEFLQGRFSLASFYERRIRRIFPALLALLLVVSVMAYHYTMPNTLVSYAGSLLASLFSFSNFYFWHQAGYFDAPSTAKPLLHTWSLAVEEQFYMFFPLLLFIVFRWFPRYLRLSLWSVFAVTLTLSIWLVRVDSSAAFFWSPLRAWELVGGVLISQYGFAPLQRRWVREACAVAGLAFILISGVKYTSETLFPGLTAILPCAGAVLLIAAGQVGNSGVGAILSTPPFRFVGLISYSLYLWHWPILVFQRTNLVFGSRPTWERNTKLIILAVSIALATLSWRFVETPFRRGRFKPASRLLLLLNGSAALLIILIGASLLYAKGVPSRFPDAVLRVAQFENYDTTAAWREDSCFIKPPHPFSEFQAGRCMDAVAGKKTILLYGDSTAAQLYPGLVKVFPEVHFQQATSAACQPYEQISDVESQYRPNCHALWRFIHETWLPSHRPDAVILAAAWGEPSLPYLGGEIALFQNLGIPVILLGPVINFDLPLPLLLSTEMQKKEPEHIRSENLTRHMLSGGQAFDGMMREKARKEWHVSYISYFDTLCAQQIEDVAKSQWETTNGCPLFTSNGDPLLFDNHHFTISGSILFATQARAAHQLP